MGCMVTAILTVHDFLHMLNHMDAHGPYWGRDFVNVWGGGRLVREGRFEALFDLRAYLAFQQSLFDGIGQHIYSYPPASYPIAEFFSLWPYPVALVGWTIATAVLFIWAVRPWWPKTIGPAWLAVATPAALLNFWAGQYGLLIGSLFLLGWRNLDKQPRRAGMFFGLMLIKPHLAVLVPVALLARREWTAFASAALTVAAIIAITTLWFGWQPWHDFIVKDGARQIALIDLKNSFAGLMSASVAGVVLLLGGNWLAALAIQSLFSAGAIGLVVHAARRASTCELAMLVATTTFLVLPYALSYDLTVVSVSALLLLAREDLSAEERRLATYGFIAPQIGMLAASFGAPVMPLMLVGLAFAQYRRAIGRGAHQAAAAPEHKLPFKPETA
jgi:hypothetical protein